MPGKFPVVFFLFLKFIYLGGINWIFVTLKTYIILGLFLLGIERLF
jgi:hypothetical protein